MDLRHLLAHEVAAGIIATGIEGAYDSVSCSTADNYPSMGVSQWEGSRGDNLLSWIDGGRKFIGRTYSGIVDSEELAELRAVLDSEQGRAAQLEILAADCLDYVDALMPYISNSKCVIYAGMWCPTSINVVRVFVRNRKNRGYDVDDLSALAAVFEEEYYVAAAVGNAYKQGYANRARATYNYLAGHDIDWGLLDV
jgi:hypothetical protein|nr:MAG TPA_asm: hypothetical protein [Caudoviricetes sp.]